MAHKSKTSLQWYPRYPGDFIRDTGHLTLVEDGAYNRMLDHYYASRKPLPDNTDALIRICRAISPEEQAAVKSVADEFFPVNGDGKRHNKRADSEIEKQTGKSLAASQSAIVRWQKERNANAMRTHSEGNCERNAIHSHSHSHTPETEKQPNPTEEVAASAKPTQPKKRKVKLADDEEWLSEIKEIYKPLGVDIDRELAKARAWLLTPKGRGRQLTRQFFGNWLSKCDRNMEQGANNANQPPVHRGMQEDIEIPILNAERRADNGL